MRVWSLKFSKMVLSGWKCLGHAPEEQKKFIPLNLLDLEARCRLVFFFFAYLATEPENSWNFFGWLRQTKNQKPLELSSPREKPVLWFSRSGNGWTLFHGPYLIPGRKDGRHSSQRFPSHRFQFRFSHQRKNLISISNFAKKITIPIQIVGKNLISILHEKKNRSLF